jgi:hypothetical protein
VPGAREAQASCAKGDWIEVAGKELGPRGEEGCMEMGAGRSPGEAERTKQWLSQESSRRGRAGHGVPTTPNDSRPLSMGSDALRLAFWVPQESPDAFIASHVSLQTVPGYICESITPAESPTVTYPP